VEFIPKRLSPRIVIASNWTQIQEGGSFDARFYEYQFPKVWSDKVRPQDVYGEWFFDTWSSQQWADFLRVSILCAQCYLKYGLVDQAKNKARDRYDVLVSPIEEEYILAFLEEKCFWHMNAALGGYEPKEFNQMAFFSWLQDKRNQATAGFTPKRTMRKFKAFFEYYGIDYTERKNVYKIRTSFVDFSIKKQTPNMDNVLTIESPWSMFEN
jgi:hypothetical protein